MPLDSFFLDIKIFKYLYSETYSEYFNILFLDKGREFEIF